MPYHHSTLYNQLTEDREKKEKYSKCSGRTQRKEDAAVAAAAKSLQSCPTLCDHIYGSPPGSPIPGILQARTLEWVAISFSNACKWKVKVKSLSCVRPLATPWTEAYQAPLFMGFSRQKGTGRQMLSTHKLWKGAPRESFTKIRSAHEEQRASPHSPVRCWLMRETEWLSRGLCEQGDKENCWEMGGSTQKGCRLKQPACCHLTSRGSKLPES